MGVFLFKKGDREIQVDLDTCNIEDIYFVTGPIVLRHKSSALP